MSNYVILLGIILSIKERDKKRTVLTIRTADSSDIFTVEISGSLREKVLDFISESMVIAIQGKLKNGKNGAFVDANKVSLLGGKNE